MNIKIDDGGLWGGIIPDVLRTGRIKINLNGVILSFSEKEFGELRKMLDTDIQNLYDKSQKIVKENDTKDDIVRELKKRFDKADLLDDDRKAYVQITAMLYVFFLEYWEGDVDAFKTSIEKIRYGV